MSLFVRKDGTERRLPVRELLICLMDIMITVVCFGFVLVLNHFMPDPGYLDFKELLFNLLALGICHLFFQFLFGNYKSLWTYAESREYLNIVVASAIGYIVYFALFEIFVSGGVVSIRTTILPLALTLLAMLSLRFIYRRYRETYRARHNGVSERKPLIIIGAGNAGISLSAELLRNENAQTYPVCFVDDDYRKIGRKVHGIPVEGPISRIATLIEKYKARDVLIAIPSAGAERCRQVLDLCSPLGCHVRMLPSILEMAEDYNDQNLMKNVREVKIDDLLGRDPVKLENDGLQRVLGGKVIMVTGGGGSIGSELCRQIALQKPKKLIIVDIYENNAYDIQQELKYDHPDLDLSVEIASVRDEHKIDLLFERYHPQIVFHAAAHKHVPLMEGCPEEAIRNNVFGTYHVAKAADAYGAERFVLISTDKAVNPTNVMGASKRLCEMVVQGIASKSDTDYAAVRFGNVLGSNGSVIPLFKRQIAHGGPVTVTDKRIIRYFMTIPEAAQLVLQAGVMAKDMEIFVLDMGNPVSILSLAENLIRLSGFRPYEDIPIEETGLRPGEKLYEELLMRSNDLQATENHKIYIEKQKEPIDDALLREKLEALEEALKTDSPAEIVRVMKKVVPTYKSPEEVNSKAIADLNYQCVYEEECEPVTVDKE